MKTEGVGVESGLGALSLSHVSRKGCLRMLLERFTSWRRERGNGEGGTRERE